MSKKEKNLQKETRTRHSSKHEEGNRPPNERPASTKETLKKILPLLTSHKWVLIFVVAITAAATLLEVLGPSILGDVIDALKAQVDIKIAGGILSFEILAKIIARLAVVYFSSSIFFFLQSFVMASITQRLVRQLRERINRKLSKLPLRYFDTYVSGEVLSRIMNDVDNLSNNLQDNVLRIISSAFTIFGVLVVMLVKSWQMTLIVLVILVPSIFIATFMAKYSRKYFRKQWDYVGELNGHIEEVYNGHKIVRVFSHAEEVEKEFDGINDDLQTTSFRAQFISGLISPILSFLNNIGYLLLCIVGGLLALGGAVSIGSIMAFISYSTMFTGAVTGVGHIVNHIQSSLASAERVFAILEEEEEEYSEATQVIDGLHDNISFNNMTFGYNEGKTIIHDMNIKIGRGQVVAIVGPTGAGKTTLVNLLMRFYDVNKGSITIDGKDIRELERGNLRSVFGMVLQDTWLFKGSVRDNILYGRNDATQDEMVYAAKQARADHFISAYKDGYDFMLDENAANISQGQSQLITIARAILADPDVLILDEATSSVDTRTEILIQQALEEFMQGKTSFVIAHRLSTILNSDLILVMDDGEVIEHGKHKDLLEANGFYAELYKSQFTSSV